MNDRYHVRIGESSMIYEFESKGRNGCVSKFVIYSNTHITNIYNLGFGDRCNKTGEIDDTVVTNNGDSVKVLTTVAYTLQLFMEEYPDAYVFITGSCIVRTRLYRIGISNHLELITTDFEVFGMVDSEWEVFEKNVQYKAFLIKRKK